MTQPHAVARATLFSLVFSCTAAAQVAWQESLADALSAAREAKTMLVVTVLAPGERESDAIAEVHSRDTPLLRLSEHSQNFLLRVGPHADPQPDEERVLADYIGTEADQPYAVPYHIFVDPGTSGEGKVISSVAYGLTAGQLEWAWADAAKAHDPQFEWTLGDRARAPERIRFHNVEGGSSSDRLPPTDDEVEAALDELKKGSNRRALRRALQQLAIVIRSDEKNAVKYATTALRGARGFGRILPGALRAVGEVSPQNWSSLPLEYLADRDTNHREESARALERLRVKKTLSALKKRVRAEDADRVLGRVLRAMATIAPADKNVFRTLRKTLESSIVAEVRTQAAAAISVLEDPAVVRELLELALADENGNVRAAAAYAIASRRDPNLRELLEAKVEDERNPEAQSWMRNAIDIIKDRQKLEDMSAFIEDVLGDRWDRQEIQRRQGRDQGGDDDGGGGGGGRRRR